MLSNYKEFSEKLLTPLAKNLSWMNPNALTLIGIIPQALFFIFMQQNRYGLALIALAASCIDMFDGVIARTNNKVTAFGGFLDSTVDRVADFLIIAAFYSAGLINLNLTAILLVITFLISYVRSRGELASGGQIKFDVGFVERPERIIYLFIVLALHALFPNAQAAGRTLTYELIYLLTILSFVTLIHRIWYAYKKLS